RDDEVGAGRELRPAADHVQLALEGVLREPRRGGDKELADPRGDRTCGLAYVALVQRDVAPPDDALALLLRGRGEQLLELRAAGIVVRQEADGDAVRAGGRQLDVEHGAAEGVRDLHEDPRAVAGLRVGSGRAAVL